MARHPFVLRVAALLAAANVVVLAQATIPAPRALTISGRVESALDGAGLRRARIEVSAGPQQVGAVLTDDESRFAVDVSGPGPFFVRVSKAGFTLATTTLTRSDAARPMLVRLARGAAVFGHVLDQQGKPIDGARVTAVVEARDDGSGVPGEFTAITDDLGEYRLFGLSAGRYEIRAAPPPGPGPNTAAIIREGVPAQLLLENLNLASAASNPAAGASTQTVALRPGDEVSLAPFSFVLVDVAERTEALRRALETRGLRITTGAIRIPEGAGRIEGRVTAFSGEPVEDAEVRVTGHLFLSTVRTDRDGAFTVEPIRPGAYTLTASQRGLTVEYGQDQSFGLGRTIHVERSQTVTLTLAMPPSLHISGTLTDEQGDPVQDVRVDALRVQEVSGHVVASRVPGLRRTDDRGRFRLPDLVPGRYLVTATVDAVVADADARRSTGYAAIYYPGTPTVAGAQTIDVSSNINGVDMVLTPSRIVHVRGRAFDGDGPLAGGTVRLAFSRHAAAVAVEPRTVPLAADGTFAFSDVAPGEYLVQVIGAGPGRTGLFGHDTITVDDRPIEPLTIRTSRGVTLEGRVIVEEPTGVEICTGPTPPIPAADASCVVRPTPTAFTLKPAEIDPDIPRPAGGSTFVVAGNGDFYVTGLAGPTAFSLQSAPGDEWYIKSIVIDGQDVTAAGYDFGTSAATIGGAEITVSRNGGTITGRTNDGGKAVDSYAVVVFPAQAGRRQPHVSGLRAARSLADGSFLITGIPPGDYYVAAVSRLDGTRTAGEWQGAALLAQLVPGAERISIRGVETRTVTLRRIAR